MGKFKAWPLADVQDEVLSWETIMLYKFSEHVPTACSLSAEPHAGPSPWSKRNTCWPGQSLKSMSVPVWGVSHSKRKTCIFMGKRTKTVNRKTRDEAEKGNS